jgi:hypothetical protein
MYQFDEITQISFEFKFQKALCRHILLCYDKSQHRDMAYSLLEKSASFSPIATRQ